MSANLRGGFTLLELVVAIAILAVLAGISVVGLNAALNSARESETKSVLKILQLFADERARVIGSLERVKGRSIVEDAKSLRIAYASGGNTPATIDQSTAEAIIRAVVYEGLFPQRMEDLCGLDGVPGNLGDDDGDSSADFAATVVGDLEEYLSPASDDSPLAAPIAREILRLTSIEGTRSQFELGTFINEELLFLMFTTPFKDLELADVPSLDSIPASRISDKDEDGVPEFVDSFGTPIRVYASIDAAVRSAVSGGAPTLVPGNVNALQYQFFQDLLGANGETFADLDAADGTTDQLIASGSPNIFINKSGYDKFGSLSATGAAAAQFTLVSGGAARTCEGLDRVRDTWSRPLVVSAGPDEQWGVLDPVTGDPDPTDANTGPFEPTSRRFFGPWRFYQVVDSFGVPIDLSDTAAPSPTPAERFSESFAQDNLTGGQALDE